MTSPQSTAFLTVNNVWYAKLFANLDRSGLLSGRLESLYAETYKTVRLAQHVLEKKWWKAKARIAGQILNKFTPR
jgi:hypothetical protein